MILELAGKAMIADARIKTNEEKANGTISISFTNQIVKEEERRYLRTLPAHIKIEFQLNKDKLNLLLVHGSPRRINEYLFEDRQEKSKLHIMQEAEADIMCFGIHINLTTEF